MDFINIKNLFFILKTEMNHGNLSWFSGTLSLLNYAYTRSAYFSISKVVAGFSY